MNYSTVRALAHGTAAGTVNTLSIGARKFTREYVAQRLAEIVIESIK